MLHLLISFSLAGVGTVFRDSDADLGAFCGFFVLYVLKWIWGEYGNDEQAEVFLAGDLDAVSGVSCFLLMFLSWVWKKDESFMCFAGGSFPIAGAASVFRRFGWFHAVAF